MPLPSAANPTGKNARGTKLDLLNKMQSAGIWLVDASVTALDQKGTKLVSGTDYFAVLRACWDSHICEVVRGCKPSAILIVGRGVESAIGKKAQDLGRSIEVVTIKAPAAHMSREDITRDRRACFDLSSCDRA